MSVDEYLSRLTPPQLAEHGRIVKIVKQLAPDVTEVMSYGVLGFKSSKGFAAWFGAFKDHLSLFPGPSEQLREKLQGYVLRKGTIQFTLEKPLSDELITEFITERLAELQQKADQRS